MWHTENVTLWDKQKSEIVTQRNSDKQKVWHTWHVPLNATYLRTPNYKDRWGVKFPFPATGSKKLETLMTAAWPGYFKTVCNNPQQRIT